MLSDTNGLNITFKFFAPDKTTILSNSWITITNPEKNNGVVGRIQTDSTGNLTYFLDPKSGDHEFNITNTPTGIDYDYNSISVTVRRPKDEDTLEDIPEAWNLTISGITAQVYTDITDNTQILALYTNTVNDYIFTIDSNSTTPVYTSRKYYQKFLGSDTTFTLNTYLLAEASTVILYTQNTFLTPISGVQIDIYRVTTEGYTLIEQVQTDVAGTAGISVKANQDYYFDVFYEGTTYFEKERKQVTSANVYFILSIEDDQEYEETGNVALTFVPGYSFLSTVSYDRTIYMNPVCNVFTITSFDVNVTQDGNILYYDLVSSDVCGIQQSFNIDDDLNDLIANKEFNVMVTIIAEGETFIFTKNYVTLDSNTQQFNLLYILQNNVFEDMGCERTGDIAIDSLVPCPTLLLIIGAIMLFTAIFISRKINLDKTGIIMLIELGFFTFIGWFPIALFALIAVGTIIIVGVSNFNW